MWKVKLPFLFWGRGDCHAALAMTKRGDFTYKNAPNKIGALSFTILSREYHQRRHLIFRISLQRFLTTGKCPVAYIY